MKQVTTHHEILLFTGTTYSNLEFCSRDEENSGYKKASAKERLEKACWDGMLYELLPELYGKSSVRNNNIMWHILSGKYFLYISLGPNPLTPDHETSIDPYYFIIHSCEN